MVPSPMPAVAFVFLLVLFLVWLLSKDDIGRQPIRRVRVGAFWMYSVHAQMVRLVPQWANAATIGQTALERLGTPPPRLALRGVPFFGVE
jgi:hypothetical protein